LIFDLRFQAEKPDNKEQTPQDMYRR
jgi:hypothetical protein